MTTPRVLIVIPAWNSRRWLAGCLRALREQTFEEARILVVDGASGDGTTTWIEEHHPEVETLQLPENRGFAAAVNAGIQTGNESYVALLNADTEAEPSWLESLVTRLDASPETVGSVASKMISLDDPTLIDDAGDRLSWWGSAEKRGHGEPIERWSEPDEVLSACAGAALYRRSLFETVGLFDERYESYWEDLDLGLRARLFGYRCVFEPSARVLHQGGGSGLPRARYVTLVTANRLSTFVKNIPARLLAKYLPRLVLGQLHFLIAYRRPLASLRGYARFLGRLPGDLRRRREILSRRRVPLHELDELLLPHLTETSAVALVRRRLFGRLGDAPGGAPPK